MSNPYDEFDLDVRLHGIPVKIIAQADTEQEECNTLVSTCGESTCDDANECAGDFTLAQTCNTCSQTCGGEGGTFCEETCGDAKTCPAFTCGMECITSTCPEAGCGDDTTETCDHVICGPGGDTLIGEDCDDPSDGCGEPGDPEHDEPDDPPDDDDDE